MFEKFFQNRKERAEQERLREEESRRHNEAEQRIIKLGQEAKNLSPGKIVDELEDAHRSSGIALWPEGGMIFYRVLARAEKGNPSKEEISRFLSMLSWSEFEKFKDRSNAIKILGLVRQAPSQEFVPVLQKHLKWLEEIKRQFRSTSEIISEDAQQMISAHEVEGYAPALRLPDETRFRIGIMEEARLTRELIEICGQ